MTSKRFDENSGSLSKKETDLRQIRLYLYQVRYLEDLSLFNSRKIDICLTEEHDNDAFALKINREKYFFSFNEERCAICCWPRNKLGF